MGEGWRGRVGESAGACQAMREDPAEESAEDAVSELIRTVQKENSLLLLRQHLFDPGYISFLLHLLRLPHQPKEPSELPTLSNGEWTLPPSLDDKFEVQQVTELQPPASHLPPAPPRASPRFVSLLPLTKRAVS